MIRCIACDSTKITIEWKASCILDGKSEIDGESFRHFKCRECGEEWDEKVPTLQ